MKKQILDFIIIGVQKGGTTSLFKYLEKHPQIYMPPDKEAPFFSIDSLYERGIDWFLHQFFQDVSEEKLWGTVTPYYMTGLKKVTLQHVAERIQGSSPDVKIFAILRHPIERAFSNYSMNLRKGFEKKCFSDAISDLLESEQLEVARNSYSEANGYIVQGEYGRILSTYYELFSKKQIYVGFTDDLEKNPERFIKDLLNFLEVDSTIIPKNIGIRYYQGGTRRRLPWIKEYLVEEWGFLPWKIRLLLRRVPIKYRNAFSFWFHVWNERPNKSSAKDRWTQSITPEIKEKLIDLYENDYQRLEKLGVAVPWAEWKNNQEAVQTCLT